MTTERRTSQAPAPLPPAAPSGGAAGGEAEAADAPGAGGEAAAAEPPAPHGGAVPRARTAPVRRTDPHPPRAGQDGADRGQAARERVAGTGSPGRGPLPLLRRAPGAPPAVVAHRGSSATAPENTLEAHEGARRAGTSWVETDLRLTGDGVAVLMHDQRLDRTTDGEGDLAGTTAEQLSRLDAGSWFSADHVGARVPHLEHLVAWAVAHPDVHLLLELKGSWSPADVAPVVRAVRDACLAARTVLQSFEPRTVAVLGRAAPDLARGLLVRTGGPVDAGVPGELERLVAEHGLVAVNPGDRLLSGDPSLVGRLHALGVAVWVWTVDDADRWATLDASGVDGVITNDPGRMLAWLRGVSTTTPRSDVAA